MSPLSRSKKKLENDGWLVAIVEHWNNWSHQRQDLWSFGDLLAVRRDDCLIVQATSGGNMSARVNKIKQCQAASIWLESPNRAIEVWGWSKRGPRGKRKLWECRTISVKEAACVS
jgi:hypothetical protein